MKSLLSSLSASVLQVAPTSSRDRRLFGFRGGAHPAERKHGAPQAIEALPLPERLYIPLQQHAGAAAEAVVHAGDKVARHQLLGAGLSRVSAPVHAPTSGKIVAVTDHVAPHPSGLPGPVIVLEPDGLDEPTELTPPRPVTADVIAQAAEAAGVVGLGGAAFPSAVKLRQSSGKVDVLVVNGAECEPYLTCDDRVMRERPAGIIDGIELMLDALGADHALVGIEDNKPAAIRAMEAAAATHPRVEVVTVPTRFPTGSGKQMIRTLTGREVPAGGRSHDAGVIIHNVATALAVSRAVRAGEPLTRRIVTVAGGALREARNFDVPIGTPIRHLIEVAGGFVKPVERLVLGGPMTGVLLRSLDTPVVKSTCGVLALSADEVPGEVPGPCIRCGRCVDACPMGLLPLEMAASLRSDDLDGAVDSGLSDCILCGTCAYVCPANLPLVHHFNFGKGELYERKAESRRKEDLKRRAAARVERLAREKAEKAAAAKAQAEKRRQQKAAKARAAKEAAAAAEAAQGKEPAS